VAATATKPQKVGDVLDTRLVGEGPEGKMEWRLMASDDEEASSWVPFYVDAEGDDTIPSFMPLPGSQNLFLNCPVYEVLYEGTRGPGKSLTLLMDFAKEVGKGYGKNWRGILFRRQFGDLDDIVRKIEEWFPKMWPGFRFLKSKSEYQALWPTGEALLLRHMRGPDDYDEYHGHEYPWIGWEELTQWGDDKAYRLMMSCSRPPIQGIPCRVRSTTNPYGQGHTWVKKRFNLPDYRGKVIRNPGERDRVAIFGALKENFLLLHAEPFYEINIKNAAKNPAQASAWLDGDWDVTAGGMVDDLWRRDIHVIPGIPANMIPKGWTISRAYDHGQSHPFSVGWWLQSNGEPIWVEGRSIGNIRGDMILWGEWYGSTGQPNEGVRMAAKKIARGIFDRERDMGVLGRVRIGPADTEIWSKDSRGTSRSPADDMEDEGLYWDRADKSPGSRKRGWEKLRNLIEDAIPAPDGTRESPGLFVCVRCRNWLEHIPPMPRDEKDQDEVPDGYEDHDADMTRYRITFVLKDVWRKGF
jgi:hypothetical protein